VRTATPILTLALAWSIACSTSAKREDSAQMQQKPTSPAGSSSTGSGAPTPVAPAKVYLSTGSGDISVDVEVVSTEAKIERGLMYRQHLPTDAGMLFLMGYERDWAFWMRNTLIPLDMIFIRKDMTIAGIVENAEPKTETLRKVGEMSLYVLEVNGGWTKQHGVMPGAKVRFENLP
jgi:uncharacterized protein